MLGRRNTRRFSRLGLFVVLGFALLVVAPAAASATPTLTTDKADYAPSQVVHVTGTGFDRETTYALPVQRPDASIVLIDPITHTPLSPFGWGFATTDANGNLTYDYQLDGILGSYELRAYPDSWAGDWNEPPIASMSFTDGPGGSADLDQGANFDNAGPSASDCNPTNWVNGELGPSKARYSEGDSVPYRMRFDSLDTSAAHSVTIEWDTTKAGKHAIDYLTSFDRTVTTANPCSGVSDCSLTPTPALGGPTNSLFDIPKDPQVDNGSGSPIAQLAGAFKLYGGVITGLGPYVYHDGDGFAGDKTARITIEFTANVVNPVLAWGGHIAQRRAAGGSGGWGAGNAAVDISGASYHMRLINLDGSGGNQDRALSNDAVTFPGSITIIKQATPEGSTSFPFTASPTQLLNFPLVDDGTSANTQVFSNITTFQNYTVSETVPGGWTLNTINCGVTTPNGGSTSGTKPAVTINMKEGEDWTCTFNDSRDTGKLEVVKDLIPTADGGRFDLQIDAATEKANAGDGGTTGEKTLNTGDHTVGEIAGTTTPATVLSNYQKSIECKASNGSGAVVASVSADSAGPLTVPVGSGDDIVCTITNTRETGKLEVVKDLIPTADGGRFDLQIDAATEKANAGDGGTTGEKTLNTGDHTVGEIAGTPTPATVLSNYQKSIECKASNGSGAVVASVSDDSAGPLTVPVGSGDDIVCTITNTRETGKLEVVKDLITTADSGRLDLQIDAATEKANAGDGGTTGEKTLNTGDHTVGEIAGTPTPATVLSNYQKSIECKASNGSGAVVASVSDDSAGPLTVPVGSGDDIVCTITNTRETGKLEVVKDLIPTADGGRFDLQIDAATEKANAGDGGTTGEKTLNTGDHTVGEIAGTPTPATVLSNYQKSIECKASNGSGAVVASVSDDSAGPLTVPVGSGDDIVCTITNTRETGKLEVVKDLITTADSGRLDLQIDAATEKANAGDGGTTGEKTLNTGDHTVGEIAGTPTPATVLSNYQKSIECKASNGSGAVVASVSDDSAGPLTVPVGSGDDIVCTITNTRETGKLEVVKDLITTADSGRLDLQIDAATEKANAGDGGTTGEKTLNTGDHTVGEIAGTPTPATVLSNYQKSIECKASNGSGAVVASVSDDSAGPLTVPVGSGDDIVCTI